MSLHVPEREQEIEFVAANQSYQDPFKRINWIRLNLVDFWLPERAISLFGLEVYGELKHTLKRKLSHLEFMHMLEMALWLEALFMQRLSKEVSKGGDLALKKQYLNELREEAGHSLVFTEILQRCGTSRYSAAVRYPRGLNFLGRFASWNSPLFWIAVFLGEQISDQFNRMICRSQLEVCPAIADVALMHSEDEREHVVFSYQKIQTLSARHGPVRRRLHSFIAQKMLDRFVRSFFYPSGDLYEYIGLYSAKDWEKKVRENPHRRSFVRQIITPAVHKLKDAGYKVHVPYFLY